MSDLTKEQRDAIIKRILGLMAKTTANGCTMEEALAASAKVAELLNQYQLDMSDLELRSSPCVKDEVKTGLRGNQAIENVMTAIAYFTDTKTWRGYDEHDNIVHNFFGLEHDVLVAKYIYKICDWALVWDWEDYKKTPPFQMSDKSRRGKIKASFQDGEAFTLAKRLRDMKNAQKKQNIETTGRDLVVVKSALVTDEFAKLNLGLKFSKRGTRSYDNHAFGSGAAAGEKVALNPGVHGSNPAGHIR